MKKKCYIYTRVSTLAQVDGYSLDAQRTELCKYAEYNDLEIAGEYCDAGISGGSIRGRHDFQKMMDDVIGEKDSVSYILVFKLSRFGRNAADVLRSVQLLQDYDVNLVSVNDGIDSSTSGGKLMISILSAVAEIEKDNITVQFSAGKMQKFKNGGWAGGPVPYGYQNKDGRLVVVEEEAKIVRLIFEMYAKDENGLTTIIRYLNDNGYKNRHGKVIKRSFVYGILGNPLYCGDLFFNRRTNIKNAKPKEIIYAKGIHEPIISEELFYKVKDKLDDKSKIYERTEDSDRVNILSGLLKCPLCGAGMVADHSVNRSPITGERLKNSHIYRCPNHRKENGRTCTFNKALRQELLDAAVYEYVSRVRNLGSFTSYMEDKLVNREEYEKIEADIRSLRKKYYRIESDKDKVNKSIDALDVLDDNYDEQYFALSAQADELYDELDMLEEKISKVQKNRDKLEASKVTLGKIYSYLENFPEIYKQLSAKEKREMMRLLIDRIELFPERREDGKLIKAITFKFPVFKIDKDGKAEKTIDQSVGFRLRCDIIGRTAAESKTSYAKIKQFIFDKHNVKVSSLYVAQIKRKYGIIERKNYRVTKKGDDFKQPTCPQYKEELIVEALKHFKMIENEVSA